ncbi:MAG: sulfurtransferase TusA family protein [Syntrophomonadaceae bacterium]|nr:sulfurtransferase TusA family protein [Syntrophomonadaceae bacterium]
MEKIDVSGLSCPIPVVRTKKLIDAGNAEILVTGDSSVSKENITKLAAKSGYGINVLRDEKGAWELELRK